MISNELVDRFFAAAEGYPELRARLRSPVDPDDLHRLEDELGAALPPTLLAFLQRADGTRDAPLLGEDLLPAAAILETKRSWDRRVARYREDRAAEDVRLPTGAEHELWYWSDAFVPFALGRTRLRAVDTRGAKSGRRMQVVTMGVDQPGAGIDFDTIEDWLTLLLGFALEKRLVGLEPWSEAVERARCRQLGLAEGWELNRLLGLDNRLTPADVHPDLEWGHLLHV